MDIASNQNYICFPGKREEAALCTQYLGVPSSDAHFIVCPQTLCLYSPSNGKISLLF